MNRLIDDQGHAKFGIFKTPVDEINYRDYRMTTPMGSGVSSFFKKLLFNQFVFFGLTGPDVIIGIAVVDLKYLSNGFLYIYDRESGDISEANKTIVPVSRKIFISPTPDHVSCGFSFGNLSISMEGTKISAKSKEIEVNLTFDRSRTAPLRICTKAGYRGWVYTEKSSPINVTGEIIFKDRRIEISSPSYMGLMDWTAGYMRRQTFWNWAATAATLADGRSFGMNLSCGVNETSFTENAFWIDGQMTKVDTVAFEFNSENFYDQWQIKSLDEKIDLVFAGRQHREENINAGVVATKFTQLMGLFNGHLKTDTGEVVEIKDCPGWAEDHYAKW